MVCFVDYFKQLTFIKMDIFMPFFIRLLYRLLHDLFFHFMFQALNGAMCRRPEGTPYSDYAMTGILELYRHGLKRQQHYFLSLSNGWHSCALHRLLPPWIL